MPTKPKGTKKSGSSRHRRTQKPPNHDVDDVHGLLGDPIGAAAGTIASVRLAWLPHFQRVVDSPRASVDRAIQEVAKSTDAAVLRAEMESLQIGDKGAAKRDVGMPTERSAATATVTAAALLHFLDCALVSTIGDDNNESGSAEAGVRVFQLIAGVAAETGTVGPVTDRAIEFASTLVDRVRSNALLFLKHVVVVVAAADTLSHENREDTNAILDAVAATLTEACTDKSKLVRSSAVDACQALLALDSVEADVLQSVIWVMQHDPVPVVRAAALHSLPLTAETVEAVVARVRDVSPVVRVAALTKLKPLGSLDAELAAAVVQSGYTERCHETRQATVDLIAAWLECADGDPAKLLEALNVTYYEKQCETVVKVLLLDLARATASSRIADCLSAMWTSSDSGEDADDGSNLSIEALFLARVVAKEQPAMLDALDWDVPQVTSVLERTIDRLRSQILQEDDEDDGGKNLASIEYTGFICQQLVMLASALASSEVGAARHLQDVLALLLSDPATPDALIDAAVQALFEPLKVKQGGTVSAGRVDETTQIVVRCIQSLQSRRDESTDSADEYYAIRILSIWTVLLEHAPILTPDLDALVRDALEPVLLVSLSSGSSNPREGDSSEAYAELIREAAVSCLGKLGLLMLVTTNLSGETNVEEDKTSRIHDYRRRLVEVAKDGSYKAEIRAQAMLSLSDWTASSNAEDGTPALLELDDLLVSWLDHDDTFLLSVAGEVAAKLLFANKALPSSKVLLARLVLVSLDGTLMKGELKSDADCEIGSPVRLQQLASFFFPAFAATCTGRSSLVGCIPAALDLSKKKPAGIVSYVCDVARQGLTADSETTKKLETCVVDVVSVQAAIELAVFVTTRELTGAFLLAVCKTLGALSLLREGEPQPSAPPNLPNNVKRLLLSLQRDLDELSMTVDNRRALNELGYLQSTLAAFEVGNADEDSVSSQGDLSVPSSSQLADDDQQDADSSGTQELQDTDETQGRDDDKDANVLVSAFSMTKFFGNNKENSRTSRRSTSLSCSSDKNRRRQSSESVLTSVEDGVAILDVHRDSLSTRSGPIESESAIGRDSDVSRSTRGSRSTSSRAANRQSSMSSKGGKKRNTAAGDSVLTKLGDLVGEGHSSSVNHKSLRARAKGRRSG